MKSTTATHTARTTGASPIAASAGCYFNHAAVHTSLRPRWPPPGRSTKAAREDKEDVYKTGLLKLAAKIF